VSVAVTDTPPAGVTVLSFEVTITGATLNPPAGGGTPVNLLPGGNPIKIEVKQLETEAAFFSTMSVPAGSYSGFTFNFSNAELTIKNDTGATITFAGIPCLNGQTCEFKPGAPASFTYTGSPFPVTLSSGSSTGFLVDVNLSSIITDPLGVNFAAAGALTVVQLPLPGQPTGQLEEIEDVCGIVFSKDPANNQFVLRTSTGDLTIKVDNNTRFEGFNEATPPLANSFASVAVNQILEADLKLIAGGMLLAEKVEMEDSNINEEEIEAIISRVIDATHFEIVPVEICPPVTGLEVGDVLTVTLQIGASFRVDEDGLNVPTNLRAAFENAVDTSQLTPGQQIHVRRRSDSTSMNINTDRVRLRRSRFTGTVASLVLPDNFNVNTLPAIFGPTPATEIEVQTDGQTDFDNVPGDAVSGLAVNNTVSLRGLLFKRTSPPKSLLIAKKVRRR